MLHLQNAWLWECETKSDLYWNDENLAQRCKGCVVSLLKFVQDENLPLYFCKDANLLVGQDKRKLESDVTKLQDILEDVCVPSPEEQSRKRRRLK